MAHASATNSPKAFLDILSSSKFYLHANGVCFDLCFYGSYQYPFGEVLLEKRVHTQYGRNRDYHRRAFHGSGADVLHNLQYGGVFYVTKRHQDEYPAQE
jgi:fructose-1,6-bisphosphatase